MMLAVYSLKNL